MYGKIFQSTFTGSMYGAGPEVFSVWSYVIASTVAGSVELNPILLSHTIGMPVEAVEAAIEKLCAPDPRSRNKDFEGRRLIREGEFQYVVPSHETYREMRSEDSRREYQRRWVASKRDKEKRGVTNHVDIDSCRQGVDESTSASVSDPSPLPLRSGVPERARSMDDAKHWTGGDWHKRFNRAWSEAYNTAALPWGGMATSKAIGELDDMLGEMDPGARAAAEARAPAMITEYLRDRSPAIVRSRHPFSWFVTRFQGLLVPAKEAQASQLMSPDGIGHGRQAVIERVAESDAKL